VSGSSRQLSFTAQISRSRSRSRRDPARRPRRGARLAARAAKRPGTHSPRPRAPRATATPAATTAPSDANSRPAPA